MTDHSESYYITVEETGYLTDGKQWEWYIMVVEDEKPNPEEDEAEEHGYARTQVEAIANAKFNLEQYLPEQPKVPKEKGQRFNWLPEVMRKNNG